MKSDFRLPWLAMLFGIATLSGCAASKVEKSEPAPRGEPPIHLSSEEIYSPAGDMRAQIPQGWVALDAARFENPEIFAVFCDRNYSMSLVFSSVPIDKGMTATFRQRGMKGLLKHNYEERLQRISSWFQPVLLDVEEFVLGRHRFGAYTFTNDDTLTATRVALFYTRENLYECTITHLPLSESELPPLREMREIHQIVLGGVEW